MRDLTTDIVIPVHDGLKLTEQCVESIQARTKGPYRLIIIDNASGQAMRSYLGSLVARDPRVKVLWNTVNAGWVKALNQGIRVSTAPYVIVMNNDTIVRTDDWIAKLIDVAEAEETIGLVNPRFKLKAVDTSTRPYVEIDFCRGYCILIKRAVFQKAGLFDEIYGMGYYDDDDFSVRALRQGFLCVRAREVHVEHLGDSTFSELYEDDQRSKLHEENKKIFYEKWGSRLRIVVIATRKAHVEELKATILDLARRQHIVYLWNLGAALDIAHASVREKRFVRIFQAVIFSAILALNKNRRPEKRYDLIFADDARLLPESPDRFIVDYGKDRERIKGIVHERSGGQL